MKRVRISRVTDSNIQVHYSGPSFSDLPADVFQVVLFKLPIRSVVVCKSVCKTWHDLISDPEFAKLHFDETCDLAHPLYHISDSKPESEKLYLPLPENIQLKIGMCEHTYSNLGCVCNVKFSPAAKFKLPIDDQCSIVNSCNGLLCFSLGAHVIICNPVLGEFLSLPVDKKADGVHWHFINYGFGFGHVANKYKVVKIFSNRWGYSAIARVHTVGTEAWRDISIERYFLCGRPTYIKGFLYWFLHPLSFIFFDVEKECFGLDQGPDLPDYFTHQWTAVGALAGDLCLSFATCFWTFHVWATKGVEKAWSRVLSIDLLYVKHIGYPQPMKHFSDGSLLMFNVGGKALVLVDPIKCKYRYYNIHKTESKVEAMFAHIPSLVSLRHSLSGNNTKVLNLRSSHEELKLQKQAKDLQLYTIET